MAATSIGEHESATYFTLRWGIALLGVVLPWLLWLGGLLGGRPLQDSMSAYYHTGMRDELVGVLIAVGVLLVVYRGYTQLENLALDLGGAFLAGVALVPMSQGGGFFSLHGTFAVLFFLCIAYVCLFRAGDTLVLVTDPARRRRLRLAYRITGTLMLASPAVAVALSFLLVPGAPWRSIVFLVEGAGVYAFAAYWVVKGLELRRTGAERLAMAGELSTRRYGLADAFRTIEVVPTPAPQAAAPAASAPREPGPARKAPAPGDLVPVRL
jgi:hypothetical protein